MQVSITPSIYDALHNKHYMIDNNCKCETESEDKTSGEDDRNYRW